MMPEMQHGEKSALQRELEETQRLLRESENREYNLRKRLEFAGRRGKSVAPYIAENESLRKQIKEIEAVSDARWDENKVLRKRLEESEAARKVVLVGVYDAVGALRQATSRAALKGKQE